MHAIDSRPFHCMTMRPPIPEYNLFSMSKVKAKVIPVSAAFFWFISLVFHIRASNNSRPYRSLTIGPPIPEIQIDLENSRSKVKVKGTPVSAASSWLIFLVFHTRASYLLPSLRSMTIVLPFPEIQFDLENSSSKVKDKGQGQRYPSQRSIQLTHFIISHQLDQPFLRCGKYNVWLEYWFKI